MRPSDRRRLDRLEAATGATEPRGEFTVHVSTVTGAEARHMREAEARRPRAACESMTDIEIVVVAPAPPTADPA